MDRIDKIRSKLEYGSEIGIAIGLGITKAIVLGLPKGLAKRWRSFVPSLMGLDIYRETNHEADELNEIDDQEERNPSRTNFYHRATGAALALVTEGLTYGVLAGNAIKYAETDPNQAAFCAVLAVGLRPLIYGHHVEEPREKRLSAQDTRLSHDTLDTQIV